MRVEASLQSCEHLFTISAQLLDAGWQSPAYVAARSQHPGGVSVLWTNPHNHSSGGTRPRTKS
eukprot:9324969-Pyramimonas_sp.AAC.1